MKPEPGTTAIWTSVVLMGALLFWIHHFMGQDDGVWLVGLTGLSFLLYGYLCFANLSARQIFVTAIFLRAMLLWGMPNLSDDIYRFVWDGCITLSGNNPYGILPTDALRQHWSGVNQSLFAQLNSPDYFTVYPPVAQCFYAVAALGESLPWSAFILRIILIATEIAGIWCIMRLLPLWHLPISRVAIFALNPLVLLEGTGNLHFEPALFSILAISLYLMERGRWKTAALWMAVSVGLKLLPLMLFPWLWMRSDKLQRRVFFTHLGLWLLLIFSPLLLAPGIWGLGKSVGLYFQTFEFNASVYYMSREFVRLFTGYNAIAWIGPALGLTAGISIFVISLRLRRLPLSGAGRLGLLAWTIYLLLATTVHPWYVTGPLFFGLFSGSLYPVVWSWLVFFSYTLYNGPGNAQWNVWIFAEYLLLLAFILVELWRKKEGTTDQ